MPGKLSPDNMASAMLGHLDSSEADALRKKLQQRIVTALEPLRVSVGRMPDRADLRPVPSALRGRGTTRCAWTWGYPLR